MCDAGITGRHKYDRKLGKLKYEIFQLDMGISLGQGQGQRACPRLYGHGKQENEPRILEFMLAE